MAGPDEHRRAHHLGVLAGDDGQGHPAPAGQMARAAGHRPALPPAVRRSLRQPRGARDVQAAQPDHRRRPPLPGRPRLLRGGDARAPADLRWSRGQALHDPSQRPGHAAVPADQPGTLPQAAAGRRNGAGLRVLPRVPQRGGGQLAQPRVHAAGALPGLRRLPRHDGDHRGTGRRGHRTHRRRLPPPLGSGRGPGDAGFHAALAPPDLR